MAKGAISRPLSVETEESLIDRIIRFRDEGALAEIYDRFASIVYSIALRVLHEKSSAEEVMQEVFIQIWRNPSVYDSERGSLCNWLTVATRNRAIDRLRQRKPERGMEDVMIASHVNVADPAERAWAIGEARRAMRSLPILQRRALELAFFEGMTLIEIAASTGDSLDVVNNSIRNALLSIRSAVKSSAWDERQIAPVGSLFRPGGVGLRPKRMAAENPQSDSGMYLRDLLTDEGFEKRKAKPHDVNRQSLGFRRLTKTLVQAPDSILQELVNTTVDLCDADSAGISLEEPESLTFRWVAVAGSFSKYINGRTDRNHSPCGTCLDTGRPQLYRVTKPFYDYLGLTAQPITDGVLIPWVSGALKGTLWAVSHSAEEAFDREDFLILSNLADFASTILGYQHQQFQVRTSALAQMANDIAHSINNPLQRLTNTIFLARRDNEKVDQYLKQAEEDLMILSQVVAGMLIRSFDRSGHSPLLGDS